MANRPKRNKTNKASSPPISASVNNTTLDSDEAVSLNNKKKAYRNNPKKRKPFVQYISLRKYQPKGLDKYFGNNNGRL